MAVNGTITTAGAAYLSQRISSMATVTIDHFVMASVPGIDETTEADQNFVLAEECIVATAPVYRLAHNGENSVVYSMVLDGNEGDYDFNWYGLVTNTGVILAFAHIPPVAKRASVGQVINRNFILPFTAAKALTGADIPSESWQFDFTETIAEVTVSLSGPRSIYAGDSYTYSFTDWDDFSDYSASVDVGTATLSRAKLTVSIPSNTTAEQCLITLIRNGSTRIIPIRIGDPIVAQPTLISPVNGAPNIVEQPTLTASSFKTFPSNVDSHVSTDWELYDANNNLVFSSYNNTTNKTSLKLGAGVLREGGRGYKWRVRYKGASLGLGEWSGFYSFTTKEQFVPEVIGESFRGGYFAGVIENGAERYALIVSPKSSGEFGPMKYKTSKEDDPGRYSLWNGWANNVGLNDSEHPLVKFCSELSIGGYDDWYVPSRDELEMMYRNLKPSTYANSSSSRVGDGLMGENLNSSPSGRAYTRDDPQQTTLSQFAEGGAEAFGNMTYVSSSRFDASSMWYQGFRSGHQWFGNGDSLYWVRAVRRVQF